MKILYLLPLFIFFHCNLSAQEFGSYSLVGIDTVYVDVIVDIEGVDGSVLNNSLRNRLELRLRQNNFKIGSNQYSATVEFYLLGLPIKISDSVSGYALSYNLSLKQTSTSLKNGMLSIPVTWRTGGIALRSGYSEGVRELLESLIDEFLNDYYSMNEN